MKGMKMILTTPKMRKVYSRIPFSKGGVICTMKKSTQLVSLILT